MLEFYDGVLRGGECEEDIFRLSFAANWDLNAVPTTGDALVFPSGAANLSNSNDIVAGTSFASITFGAGASAYTLSGNALVLSGGAAAIAANNTSLTMTISLNITFSTAAPTIAVASGGTLTISGTIDNGGYLITHSCIGTGTLSGVISGTGGFTKTGAGTCTLSAINTFSGTTTINTGTLTMGGTSGNVGGNIVNDATLNFTQTGSPVTITAVISGTGAITCTATNLELSGNNTYTGLTTLNGSSKLAILNNNALGATSSGTIINSSAALILAGSGYTFAAEPLTINSTGNLRTSANGATDIGDYTGPVTLGANRTFRAFETNDILKISGVISGGFTVGIGGSGTTIFSGINTYTGSTTLTTGTLQLGASGVIVNTSDIILSGGVFSTGSGAGFDETVGTLTLTANSTIALGTGSHSLNFAASNGTSWTGATLLRITGWQGNWNSTAGTSGQIFTGSSTELSAGKLNQIFFTHPLSGMPYTATQLASGEIVPTSTLPVKLLAFTAEKVKNTNELHWITATEINSEYFEVLRSPDGVNFESIAKVKAAGNSKDLLDYVFVDYEQLNGLTYYQLKQYDYDGANEVFNIVAIDNSSSEFKMNALFPNPANNSLAVNFQSKESAAHFMCINDARGNEVYSATIAAMRGENQFNVPTQNLSNGIYFVRIVSQKNEKISVQIVVQH